MKDIKEFLVKESAEDAEFPDVLGAFQDWFGPSESKKVYEEIFEEIFNVADNGASTVDEVKKALVESWK